jgi:S-adenosylmethionine decarboxylase
MAGLSYKSGFDWLGLIGRNFLFLLLHNFIFIIFFFIFRNTDGAAYCLGAVNRDCWYLYTLNPYASPAGHSLSALLAGATDGDDGFGASDGEEGTDGSSSDGGCDGIEDSGSDGADSSDDSLDLRTMNLSGLNKRNVSQRYSISLGGGRGSNTSEADQTLEIMMSDLDPEVMAIFTKQFSANAAEATQVLRI